MTSNKTTGDELKCISCGEPVDENTVMSGNDGETLCEPCYSDDIDDHATTVVRYQPDGEKNMWRIGPYTTISDTDDSTDILHSHFDRPHYVKTDGWRGYYAIKATGGNLVRIADGWITEYPDDTVSHKAPTEELYKKLESGAEHPFTIWWIFLPTSNIFSTAADLYIPAGDVEAFKAWTVDTLGITKEELAGAFN